MLRVDCGRLSHETVRVTTIMKVLRRIFQKVGCFIFHGSIDDLLHLQACVRCPSLVILDDLVSRRREARVLQLVRFHFSGFAVSSWRWSRSNRRPAKYVLCPTMDKFTTRHAFHEVKEEGERRNVSSSLFVFLLSADRSTILAEFVAQLILQSHGSMQVPLNSPLRVDYPNDEIVRVQVIGVCQSVKILHAKLRSVSLFEQVQAIPALGMNVEGVTEKSQILCLSLSRQ